MPQMLASQNKPECESQEHFEWCQLSARQSDVPRVRLCVLPERALAHTPVSAAPCFCPLCERYLCRYSVS